MQERILKKLEKLFKASRWETVEITMKSTGLKIELTPHFNDFGATPDPRDIEHCAFITSSGEKDAIWYTGTPLAVAGYLTNHDEIHRRWFSQAMELARMADNTQGKWTDDDWSDYSDLYKETYGRRPVRHPDEKYIVVEVMNRNATLAGESNNLTDAIDVANELLAAKADEIEPYRDRFVSCHSKTADREDQKASLDADCNHWNAHILKIA